MNEFTIKTLSGELTTADIKDEAAKYNNFKKAVRLLMKYVTVLLTCETNEQLVAAMRYGQLLEEELSWMKI